MSKAPPRKEKARPDTPSTDAASRMTPDHAVGRRRLKSSEIDPNRHKSKQGSDSSDNLAAASEIHNSARVSSSKIQYPKTSSSRNQLTSSSGLSPDDDLPDSLFDSPTTESILADPSPPENEMPPVTPPPAIVIPVFKFNSPSEAEKTEKKKDKKVSKEIRAKSAHQPHSSRKKSDIPPKPHKNSKKEDEKNDAAQLAPPPQLLLDSLDSSEEAPKPPKKKKEVEKPTDSATKPHKKKTVKKSDKKTTHKSSTDKKKPQKSAAEEVKLPEIKLEEPKAEKKTEELHQNAEEEGLHSVVLEIPTTVTVGESPAPIVKETPPEKEIEPLAEVKKEVADEKVQTEAKKAEPTQPAPIKERPKSAIKKSSNVSSSSAKVADKSGPKKEETHAKIIGVSASQSLIPPIEKVREAYQKSPLVKQQNERQTLIKPSASSNIVLAELGHAKIFEDGSAILGLPTDTADEPEKPADKRPSKISKSQYPEPLETVTQLDDSAAPFHLSGSILLNPPPFECPRAAAPSVQIRSTFDDPLAPVSGWPEFQVPIIPPPDDATVDSEASSIFDLSRLLRQARVV